MKAPMIRHWDLVAWGIVLLGLSGTCVFHAYEEHNIGRHFNGVFVTASGVVTDATPGWEKRGPMGDSERPITEYRFKTSDGIEHDGISNEEYISVGEIVEIEYLPSDPLQNRIKGTDPARTHAVGSLFLAFLAALMSYSFLSTAGPKNREQPSSLPFAGVPMIVLCAASAYMLLDPAGPEIRSHGYYQILRWLVCLSSIVVAANGRRWGNQWIPWLFGAIAILFNPVAPIHFPRASWRVIDIVTAVVMLITAFHLKPKRCSVEHSPV